MIDALYVLSIDQSKIYIVSMEISGTTLHLTANLLEALKFCFNWLV